jgi:glycosyltransferase involved in cell wall biosynthesis
VPIYNVEEYLEWCLDSLVAQTFVNIEIVCVNDGSTDASRDIALRYAQRDPRVVLIDKVNGGLSSARNAGIYAATAPLVCFVDSDDRMTLDACEKIVAAFEKSNADVVTFGAHCYPESAGEPWLAERLSPRDVEYDGFAPDLLFKEMSLPYAWRTACKRDFLVDNNLFFREDVAFGEDQIFHFALYPRAQKTVLMSNKLYDYRIAREGSLMHRFARDTASVAAEHVNIVEHIFADWAAGGFLRQYPAEMLIWSHDFALIWIAEQDDPLRSSLLSNLRNVWLTYFSEKEILALKLPWATKRMIKAALLHPESFKGLRGKVLRHSYGLQQEGFREEFGKLRWAINHKRVKKD